MKTNRRLINNSLKQLSFFLCQIWNLCQGLVKGFWVFKNNCFLQRRRPPLLKDTKEISVSFDDPVDISNTLQSAAKVSVIYFINFKSFYF